MGAVGVVAALNGITDWINKQTTCYLMFSKGDAIRIECDKNDKLVISGTVSKVSITFDSDEKARLFLQQHKKNDSQKIICDFSHTPINSKITSLVEKLNQFDVFVNVNTFNKTDVVDINSLIFSMNNVRIQDRYENCLINVGQILESGKVFTRSHGVVIFVINKISEKNSFDDFLKNNANNIDAIYTNTSGKTLINIINKSGIQKIIFSKNAVLEKQKRCKELPPAFNKYNKNNNCIYNDINNCIYNDINACYTEFRNKDNILISKLISLSHLLKFPIHVYVEHKSKFYNNYDNTISIYCSSGGKVILANNLFKYTDDMEYIFPEQTQKWIGIQIDSENNEFTNCMIKSLPGVEKIKHTYISVASIKNEANIELIKQFMAHSLPIVYKQNGNYIAIIDRNATAVLGSNELSDVEIIAKFLSKIGCNNAIFRIRYED